MDLPTLPTSSPSRNDTGATANVERLLSSKELAYYLGRHVNYIYLMKKAGFPMPGKRATLASAVHWLEHHPNWRHYLPPGTR